jgi:hypothetical protein
MPPRPAPVGPEGISVFAADELARELHSTWQSTADRLGPDRAPPARLRRATATAGAAARPPPGRGQQGRRQQDRRRQRQHQQDRPCTPSQMITCGRPAAGITPS